MPRSGTTESYLAVINNTPYPMQTSISDVNDWGWDDGTGRPDKNFNNVTISSYSSRAERAEMWYTTYTSFTMKLTFPGGKDSLTLSISQADAIADEHDMYPKLYTAGVSGAVDKYTVTQCAGAIIGYAPLYDQGMKPNSNIFQIFPKINLRSWMRYLSGNSQLTELSIPGTHDTVATYDNGSGGLTQAQDKNIGEQLNDGIRFLDIRLAQAGNDFQGRHGDHRPYKYQYNSLTNMLNEVTEFLRNNPSETIIMTVKQDDTASDPSYPNPDHDFAYNFFAGFVFPNSALASTPEHPNQSPDMYSKYWYVGNQIPKLSDVRGKIVLIRLFTLSTQDFSDLDALSKKIGKGAYDKSKAGIELNAINPGGMFPADPSKDSLPKNADGIEFFVQNVYKEKIDSKIIDIGHSALDISDLSDQSRTKSTTLCISYISGTWLADPIWDYATWVNPGTVACLLNRPLMPDHRVKNRYGIMLMDWYHMYGGPVLVQNIIASNTFSYDAQSAPQAIMPAAALGATPTSMVELPRPPKLMHDTSVRRIVSTGYGVLAARDKRIMPQGQTATGSQPAKPSTPAMELLMFTREKLLQAQQDLLRAQEAVKRLESEEKQVLIAGAEDEIDELASRGTISSKLIADAKEDLQKLKVAEVVRRAQL